MPSGLHRFKKILSEFRSLSTWALGATGASIAVPFVAGLSALSPPWPPGIVPATAILELVTLVLAYQLLSSSNRRTINRVVTTCFAALLVASLAYMVMLSLFTYQIPNDGTRFAKGFVCTQDAMRVFVEKCPDLGLDELSVAEYRADRLWTNSSIAIIRTSLLSLWMLAFLTLTMLLGSFLVFQTRRRVKR